MFIISERINGQFISVGKAIDNRDSTFIQELTLKQVESGAQALDINVGPGRDNGPEDMAWLVKTVQEVTEIPLCIDAFGPKTMEAGVKACNNPVIMIPLMLTQPAWRNISHSAVNIMPRSSASAWMKKAFPIPLTPELKWRC